MANTNSDNERRGVVDRVKWDADDETLAYKFPSEDLSTWTQLIVAESQEAVLVHGGQMEGPFAAGRHSLTTENLPLLREVMGLPFGGKSPFTAEVWYVNRSIPLDVEWGFTEAQAIQLMDPVYNVMLPVVAAGQYGVAIDHTKRFLVQMVGTKKSFSRQDLQKYLRGVILTKAKDLIARYIVEKRISILQISARLSEISDQLRAGIEPEITRYGLRLDSFFVTGVNTQDADPAVARLKMALADSSARSIQGYTYQQERSLDVLQTAAGNEGMQGTMMGSGIGLGMGLGLGNTMGAGMGNIAKELNPAPAAPAPAAAAPAGPDRLAVLKELAQMHKDGVLTDEEFAQEKRRVLGGA